MKFLDANITCGIPAGQQAWAYVKDAQALQRAMDRAGVAGGLVRREEQFYAGPVTGNRLVAADVRQTGNLWGVWSMLPPHTREIPGPDEILPLMRENRIAAWQFMPGKHHFPFHACAIGEWLELAQARRIPILADLSLSVKAEAWLEMLRDFPGLRIILCLDSVWPRDRVFRPLVSGFPGVMLELSWYMADHGLEELVREYGAERFLFGSRFHQSYFGGTMLLLRHARISDAERGLIAGENLRRLLAEVEYD